MLTKLLYYHQVDFWDNTHQSQKREILKELKKLKMENR
jgi:hypothetical protein